MADYRAAARRAARRYGLDPDIFERQIQQESGFDPNAGSPAGARGIAQIMPATAKSWGVDPSDPIASLNAAAKNMRRYVSRYGSYENALRAYNAGPGAIDASKGFSETNAYVAKILGNSTPKAPSSSSSRTTTTTTPGSSTAEIVQALRAALPERTKPTVTAPTPPAFAAAPALPAGYTPVQTQAPDKPDSLKAALAQIATLQGPTVHSATTAGSQGVGDSQGVGGSQIKELFWQGPGGLNIKNGKRVPQGFVSGHTDHVHVAAGPKTVVRLGEVAQDRFGLTVGENPSFEGGRKTTSGHVPGSYHYRNQAIDVTGDPKKLAAFARYVARQARGR